MKRLIRITLPLCILLGLLCAGVVFIAQLQPKPDLLPELRRCENTLCFLEIQVGKTSWDESFATFRTAPELEILDIWPNRAGHQAVKAVPPRYSVELFSTVRADVNVLAQINMIFQDRVINAGMVVAEFGPPCYVNHGIPGVVTLNYLTMSFTFAVKSSLLSHASSLNNISLHQASANSCAELVLSERIDAIDWYGFTAYSAHMTELQLVP